MRKLLILGVFILAVVVPVRAQEYPKAEVFGGYQYLRLNPGGTNCQGFGCAAVLITSGRSISPFDSSKSSISTPTLPELDRTMPASSRASSTAGAAGNLA